MWTSDEHFGRAEAQRALHDQRRGARPDCLRGEVVPVAVLTRHAEEQCARSNSAAVVGQAGDLHRLGAVAGGGDQTVEPAHGLGALGCHADRSSFRSGPSSVRSQRSHVGRGARERKTFRQAPHAGIEDASRNRDEHRMASPAAPRGRPLRPLVCRAMHARPPRLAVIAVALAAALAGCGKSLPSASTRQGASAGQPLAPVIPEGAGGLSTKNTTRLGGADAATDAAAVALAVHPGLVAVSRPQATVIVDERDWAAALAASALASAPLKAPLLYGEGATLPEVSAQALKTMRPTGAAALGGVQAIVIGATPDAVPPVAGYRTRALTNADPYALAAQVQRLLSAVQHHEPRRVIVASADGPPALAMPAAGLAAESGAPILLVSAAGVPAPTAAALRHLHRPVIYVVGSTAAVSSAAVIALGRFGTVKRIVSPVGRIGREDPVGNAVAVALFEEGGFGWGVADPGHGLVFANSTRPLDAPAAAPLSSSGDYAPLLVLESPVGVPKVLAEYLTDIRPAYSSDPAYGPTHGAYNHGWLIGDENAIAASTQAEPRRDARDRAADHDDRRRNDLIPEQPECKRDRNRHHLDDLHRHLYVSVLRDRRRSRRKEMSQAEDPNRLRDEHEVTVEDVRQLMGASTPHFALQLRARIAKLIEGLPAGHPAREEGEREVAGLERLGFEGETRGQGANEGEPPLPSLSGLAGS